MLKKPLLPEWRFWPAFPMGALILVAVLGVSFPTPQPQQPAAPQPTDTAANNNSEKDYPFWKYSGFWTAFFTLTLTGSTIGLWIVTWKAQQITAEQIKIANAEYVASHRPKIRICLLRIDKLVVGEPFAVQYEVVNIGDTKAKIVTNEITLRIDRVLDGGRKPRLFTCQFHFADYLAPGEALLARKVTPVIFEKAWWPYTANLTESWAEGVVIVSGTISYFDDNGTLRRTGFYRICTKDVNRFRTLDADSPARADHEYED